MHPRHDSHEIFHDGALLRAICELVDISATRVPRKERRSQIRIPTVNLCDGDICFRERLRDALDRLKREHSRAKGVGAAPLHAAAPCRLYASRLQSDEFALSFGGGRLLLLQAGCAADARAWMALVTRHGEKWLLHAVVEELREREEPSPL